MADFAFSKEVHQLPRGMAVVRDTRTSNGGRDKKHAFIEAECLEHDNQDAKGPDCKQP